MRRGPVHTGGCVRAGGLQRVEATKAPGAGLTSGEYRLCPVGSGREARGRGTCPLLVTADDDTGRSSVIWVILHRHLKINHGRRIYTTDVGKHHKSVLFFQRRL